MTVIIIFKHLTSVFLTDIYTTTFHILGTLPVYGYTENKLIEWNLFSEYDLTSLFAVPVIP